jgi:hypothetical protein
MSHFKTSPEQVLGIHLVSFPLDIYLIPLIFTLSLFTTICLSWTTKIICSVILKCRKLPFTMHSCRSEVKAYLVPRIAFTRSHSSGHTLLWHQFPLAPAHATTFNGCQGLTLDMLGMDLTQPVSSHGQLYTVFTLHSPEIGTTLPKFDCSLVNQWQWMLDILTSSLRIQTLLPECSEGMSCYSSSLPSLLYQFSSSCFRAQWLSSPSCAFYRTSNIILVTHIYLAHYPHIHYTHTTKANKNSKCCTSVSELTASNVTLTCLPSYIKVTRTN